MWFKKLTGFEEISAHNVNANIYIADKNIISKVNGKPYQYGRLEIPTLQALKKQASALGNYNSKITISEIVADVQTLHCDIDNVSALFQSASQFNLLEMVSPNKTPEHGVDIYEHDFTQGPACAIACGAGTIYRNYFASVNGKIGQSFDNQIDCLDLIGKELNNEALQLWKMTNGYALLNQDGLLTINAHLSQLSNKQREHLKSKLKIGLQWDTQVTLLEKKQLVSQAYCSALPVAYSNIETIYWESFARLILEATYEATLYAALINLEKTGCNKVFLTLVGGGAFGNDMDWILESMAQAFRKFKHTPLDIIIVSYGHSNSELQKILKEFH